MRNCFREAGAGGSNPLTPTINQTLAEPGITEGRTNGRIYPTQPGRIWPTAIILAILTAAFVGIVGWVRLSNGGCPALDVIGDALHLAGCRE